MSNEQSLVNASDAAQILGVTRRRVYELAREGLIPVVRLGRTLRFSTSALDDLIEDGGRSWPNGWKKAKN